MYVIVIYDMPSEGVTHAHKLLKKYLHWIQNSVFEGNITQSDYVIMCDALKKLACRYYDNDPSIIIFTMRNDRGITRDIIGVEKAPIDNFI